MAENAGRNGTEFGGVSVRAGVLLGMAGVAAFHLAYEVRELAGLMAVYLFCLLGLSRVKSVRGAFWAGLGVGVGCYAPHLLFFWRVFGVSAIGLWLILALWPGFFVMLMRGAWGLFPRGVATIAKSKPRNDLIFAGLPGPKAGAKHGEIFGGGFSLVLSPVFWMGLEFFRSEGYWLKFSWLIPGYAFGNSMPVRVLGVYGVGFVLMGLAAGVYGMRGRWRILAGGCVLAGAVGAGLWRPGGAAVGGGPLVVGIQLEQPTEKEVLTALDGALAKNPGADIFVLSEYTFGDPPPASVLRWCNEESRTLIVGGMEPMGGGDGNQFRDTVYVVGPTGRVVFEQAKVVPIQFMADGLPAQKQGVWESPWGKIGICICYDLSYGRVTDRLAAMGAEGLIVPSMDPIGWGGHEHWLHSLVGPARAAEYGIPIMKVGSSGITQVIDGDGRVVAEGGFPGQGEMVAGRMNLAGAGRVVADRYVGMGAAGVTGLAAILMVGFWGAGRMRKRGGEKQ